ncbi:MAG TPA: hypothetical protein VG122_07110 [Gemmata sp.]|jgi:hypothetical protein|nr:hypothetical protein [Gemmata sp.]
MMKRYIAVVAASLFLAPVVQAQGRVQLAREVAVELFERFGVKVARNVPELTARIESLTARYGEEAMLAARRGGPSAIGLMESAGANGAKAARVLAVYGEQAASRVLSRPTAMKQFVQYGDEAAGVLCRHPGVAEPLIERGGMQAVKALGTLGPQSGRRMVMMMEGELANVAHHPALLELVAKHGETAVEFLWKNKTTLAGGAALATFLANPEPFLNGTRDIASIVGENVVKPIFTLLNYVLVAVGVLLLAVIGLVYKHGPPKAEYVKLLLPLFKK